MSQQKYKTPKLITGEDKLKELIKQLIRRELEEISVTGAVSAPPSKMAFTTDEKGSKKGRKEMEKLGWSVVGEKLDPVGHEDDDVDNDGKKGTKSDKYILKRRLAVSKKLGKKKTVDKIKKHLDDLEKLDEAVSRYQRFKEYPMKDRSKISLAVQEITKMLREVDFLMSVNHKLKTELKIPKDDLWKRTEIRIAEIRSRLKSLESKLKTFHR